MEALKSGFLVWHPSLPGVRNYSQRTAFCFASTNVAPDKRVFAFSDCLLHHSISTFLIRRRLSAIRNPHLRVLRAASTNGYIDGEFRGINDEFADIKLDAGNGAVAKDFNKECFQRGRQILDIILSFLPGGSWWKVGDAFQNGSQIKGPSLICTLRRIWALVAPDKLVIIGAFSALIIAAISEISIPHFVAATIFSAQSGSKVYFYRNAQLLALMCCTFGLFSGIRGGCFGIANQFLVQRMREKLFLVLLCQDIAFFDTEAVGVLTSRLGTDCEQVSHIIGSDLNKMFRNGLQGIGALIYLVMLSWQLALSTVLLCCLMSTILFFYGRYQKNMAKFAQEVVASANEVAQETLSLARIVRTFGTEKQECGRYSKWLKKLVDINLRQNVAYGLCTWSSNTFYNATQLQVQARIRTSLEVSGLIEHTEVVLWFRSQKKSLGWAWRPGPVCFQQDLTVQQFAVHRSHPVSYSFRLAESGQWHGTLVLDILAQISDTGLRLPELEGHIKFLDVSFNYPARPMIDVVERS
ncbi:ABC transporter B family member 26, chloroplastic isoform X2 [Cryptomeria japonica]|uniref:ABC transporter B family member 26, chloroplastic isoform X2 n=1 Tax=Cryptomeria japonica TaxID=3369 RepID=UPI0027D9DED9|nr:ABC transporter B family member 26, chloroplastic isoform X2 [Cryptomeria japonica]